MKTFTIWCLIGILGLFIELVLVGWEDDRKLIAKQYPCLLLVTMIFVMVCGPIALAVSLNALLNKKGYL